MALSREAQDLRDKYLKAMIAATWPFQAPDEEVALEAVIEAAQMLKEHFEKELAELRQETD